MLHTNFVVDAALKVSHCGPTLFLLHLRVVVQDLIPQPGQVVHTELVLFTCEKEKGKFTSKSQKMTTYEGRFSILLVRL